MSRVSENKEISQIKDKTAFLCAPDGLTIKYDRLLIATGGLSFVPPISGADKKGVFTLRTLNEAITIKEFAKQSGNRVPALIFAPQET